MRPTSVATDCQATAPPPTPEVPGRAALARGVLLALGCGFVYLVVAGGFRFQFDQTNHAHHILMADAMLHGQLAIRPEALRHKAERMALTVGQEIDHYTRATGQEFSAAKRAATIRELVEYRLGADWAVQNGRAYGYWGPLTPVLMVPFVALFGLDVSDLLINVLFGALNVGLFYWLLHRADRVRLCPSNEPCRIALTLLLAFGTSHVWQTCAAQVWFAVQIVTLTAMLGAVIAACAPRHTIWSSLISGACFAAAILARNIVILVLPFFMVLIGLRARAAGSAWLRPARGRLLVFCVPVALAVGVQGAYNYARFGDVLESGLSSQVRTGGHPRFVEPFEKYGAFSLHYLPHNFKYYFWNCTFVQIENGAIWIDFEGNSMFLVTPPLLYVFRLRRQKLAFALALLSGILPLLAALLSYFATGVVQFGPRYLLDVMPLLLLLVALGMRGWLTHVGYVLVVLAIAAHAFGTYRFCDEKFTPLQPLMNDWTLPTLVALALLARVFATFRARSRALPGLATTGERPDAPPASPETEVSTRPRSVR